MQIAPLFLALSFSVPALAQTAPAQQQPTTQPSSDGAAKKQPHRCNSPFRTIFLPMATSQRRWAI
jgi:hypothetical protein